MGNTTGDVGAGGDQVATVTAAALSSAAFGGTPPVIGVGAAGSNTTASRSDHNHAALASSPLTTATTINDTVTFTTGGVTYAAPAICTGHYYRITAMGTFVAVNSATARTAQISPFWGATQLFTGPFSVQVLASAAQTTNWTLECFLAGVDTTHINVNGWLSHHLTTATSAAELVPLREITNASVVVSSGAQTLDLKFAMSVAVATDQWVVNQVLIERLQ